MKNRYECTQILLMNRRLHTMWFEKAEMNRKDRSREGTMLKLPFANTTHSAWATPAGSQTQKMNGIRSGIGEWRPKWRHRAARLCHAAISGALAGRRGGARGGGGSVGFWEQQGGPRCGVAWGHDGYWLRRSNWMCHNLRDLICQQWEDGGFS